MPNDCHSGKQNVYNRHIFTHSNHSKKCCALKHPKSFTRSNFQWRNINFGIGIRHWRNNKKMWLVSRRKIQQSSQPSKKETEREREKKNLCVLDLVNPKPCLNVFLSVRFCCYTSTKKHHCRCFELYLTRYQFNNFNLGFDNSTPKSFRFIFFLPAMLFFSLFIHIQSYRKYVCVLARIKCKKTSIQWETNTNWYWHWFCAPNNSHCM